MSGKQIITSAVGKYVAATYQHNQQQIPGHAWVQPALGDTGTKIFLQPARQLRRWRRLPLCRVPTRLDSTRPRKDRKRDRESYWQHPTTLPRRQHCQDTHILTMGSPVVPLCSGWVAAPCVCPLFRRLFPTSSPPSRFVFCQMFGLMMALMDGSHVSGSHLVIYLKTFQINRPQLSQSLSQREREVSFDSRIVQRGDFYRSRIKAYHEY